MTPVVSVVVPTVGRQSGLARLAAALAEQDDPGVAWEVVVVDNTAAGIVGGTVDGLDVTVVHEPRPGASAARNRGIAASSGEVVAFTDDDVVPRRSWLRSLVAPLLDAADLDGTGGPVLLDPAAARPRWLDGPVAAYFSHYDRGDDHHDLPGDGYVLTANAAFRRAALDRIGGFDPALGPSPRAHLTNDDVDICRKLLATGGRIAWVPDAVVVHELGADRANLRFLLRRAYAQGRSDWRLDGVASLRRGPVVREHLLASLHHSVDLVKHHPRTAVTAARLATTAVRAAGFAREAARR